MKNSYEIQSLKKDLNRLFISFSFVVILMLIISIVYSVCLSVVLTPAILENADTLRNQLGSGSQSTMDILKILYNEKTADIVVQSAQVIVYFLAFSISFAVYYLIAIKGKKKIKDYCFIKKPCKKGWIKDIFIGYAFVYAFTYIQTVIMKLMELLGVKVEDIPIEVPKTFEGAILLFIALCIFPMFFEETVFRGFSLGGLKKYGSFAVIFISSISFSLMHSRFIQLPYAFVAGIVLAWLCIKYKSLLVGMAFHFLNNFISYIQLFLTDKEIPSLMIIAGIITLTAVALGVAFLLDKIIFKKNIFKDFDKNFNNEKEYYIRKKDIVKATFSCGGFYGFLICCIITTAANTILA